MNDNDMVLNPIIAILEKEGRNEDEVAVIISEIITTSSGLLYAKMMEVLSDQDMQVIENCPTDEEADKLIAHLYSEKSGMTLEDLMQLFLKEYVTTFIREHTKIKNGRIELDK